MKFLRRVILSIFLTIFSQSTLADDADLNRVAKKTIKVGNKYAYDWPERYIRVQVVSK